MRCGFESRPTLNKGNTVRDKVVCYATPMNHIAWAAGLLEGEGSFLVRGSTPCVRVTSTDLDVLERLQQIFGGNIWQVTKRKAHWKDCWVWDVSGELSIKCIKRVQPYLLKRRGLQAKEVLDRWQEISAERAEKAKARATRHQSMLVLRSAGLTHQQIAKELGVDRSTVSKALRGTT